MAKAAVDLPDPLDASPHGKPLTSTDDLLAQLAGEEIDRLLAEVEEPGPAGPLAAAGAPALAAPVPAAPDSPEADPAEAPARPIDLAGTPDPTPESAEPAPALPADAAAAVAAAAEAARPDLTEELDAFFKTAAKAQPEAAVGTEDAAPGVAETSAAERAGLTIPKAEPAAGSAPAPKGAPAADVGDEDGPLPLYLKPLEWINAPLESCPPGLRDLIGKAAIITLVNAAAVLIYVALFRRH